MGMIWIKENNKKKRKELGIPSNPPFPIAVQPESSCSMFPCSYVHVLIKRSPFRGSTGGEAEPSPCQLRGADDRVGHLATSHRPCRARHQRYLPRDQGYGSRKKRKRKEEINNNRALSKWPETRRPQASLEVEVKEWYFWTRTLTHLRYNAKHALSLGIRLFMKGTTVLWRGARDSESCTEGVPWIACDLLQA